MTDTKQLTQPTLDAHTPTPVLRLYVAGRHKDDGDQEIAQIHLELDFDPAQVSARLTAILPSLLGRVVFSPERSLNITQCGEFKWEVEESYHRFTVAAHVIRPLPASILLRGAHEAWTREEVRKNPELVGGEDSRAYFEIVQLSTDICRHCGQEFELPRRASSALPEPCLAAR